MLPAPAHQTVRVQSARPELTGLRILCLSDTHDFQQFIPGGAIESLPKADILVHAGDFTVRGTSEEVSNFRSWVIQMLENGVVQHAVVVAGNHELTFEPWKSKHAAVRKRQEENKLSLSSVPNLHYLEDSSVEVLGLRFHGSPWTTPIRGKMEWAFQMRDIDLREKWMAVPDKGCIDVLVTHCPPCGQGDALAASLRNIQQTQTAGLTEVVDDSIEQNTLSHIGSKTLLERVLAVEPIVHIFGHFHEGYGVSHKDGYRTLFVNAATCDEDYQPVNPAIVIEFC